MPTTRVSPPIATFASATSSAAQGRFVAEGKVVLDVLFSAGRFVAESVLILDSRLAGMAQTLAKAPAGTPVYVASRAVIDAVAGFPMHRGVLAVGRRRADESSERLLAALPRQALVIALVGISNHDNMGAIFRNAAAFGADALLLDETCCDPLYRKAIRVSVGAALKIPFADAGSYDSLADALDAHGFSQIALVARRQGRHPHGRAARTPGALSRNRGRRPAGRPAGPA